MRLIDMLLKYKYGRVIIAVLVAIAVTVSYVWPDIFNGQAVQDVLAVIGIDTLFQ